MDDNGHDDEPRPARRRHRGAVFALLVAGTISLFLAIGAIWINRQALETDNWTETSSELLEDDDIRAAIATFLVDRLYAEVDVAAEIQSALPPRAAPLAGPAAGAVRNLAEQGADEALQRPRVQALWEDANRAAHQNLLKLLEGGGDALSTTGGTVTLNLGAILQDIANRTGVGDRVAGKIGPDSAQIEILRSDQLEAAQDIFDLMRPLALGLTLFGLACFGGAIALAGDRRRETLRAAGFAFIFAGILALVLRSLAGDALVDALAPTEAVRPAIESTWEIGTELLVVVANAAVVYGIAIVIAAWLAGPTRAAVATRHALAPYLRQPAWAYGGLTLFILLLIWWGPLPATRRVVPGILLFGLLIAGVEVLRRQTAREFPDAPPPQPGDTLRRWFDRLRAGRPAKRADELERLAELHDRGVLTDDEFAAQKRQLLAAGS